jgi:rhomboid protease GluP
LIENQPGDNGQNSNHTSKPLPSPARRKFPPLTLGIILITALVYGLQILSTFIIGSDLPFLYFGKINELILQGQLWRLITPILLHGSLPHILSNMYALFIIGPSIERSYGSKRFLALYLLSGMFGNVFSFLFTLAPSLGASTSIFGLVAAQTVYVYRNRAFFGRAAQPMLMNLGIIIFINMAIGLLPQIDYFGHLGGLTGGLIFAWMAGPLYELTVTPFGTTLVEKESRRLERAVLIELILIFLAALTKFIIH